MSSNVTVAHSVYAISASTSPAPHTHRLYWDMKVFQARAFSTFPPPCMTVHRCFNHSSQMTPPLSYLQSHRLLSHDLSSPSSSNSLPLANRLLQLVLPSRCCQHQVIIRNTPLIEHITHYCFPGETILDMTGTLQI